MGFLDRIVRSTREAVADPSYVEGLPAQGPARRPSLKAAIERERTRGGLVAEYKRRSPGAAVPDLPPRSVAEFLRALEPTSVLGYSCLASRTGFDGRPGDVFELARATARPVLFKEFVVGPAQVDAAARVGASAILLIARLETLGLVDVPLTELAHAAHRRGLEVLLEWHERTELRRTEDVAADMYGVNVRDLDTLEIRRDVAAETLRDAAGHHPLLGMSGVEGPDAARRFWDQGVDALLIGSAIARADDPARFVEGLHRPVDGRRR
jgi:indole-3-glycerol phosphate synthase